MVDVEDPRRRPPCFSQCPTRLVTTSAMDDYAYPNARFREGVFDLTGFEVLQDSSDVYFRLRFRNTMEPVAYSPGGDRFVPGTVIAIRKGAAGDRTLREFTHGVRFD